MFYATHNLLEMEVELIEDKVIEDQTIDIDSIEEHIPMYGTDTEMEMFGRVTDKMQEIIRAVKHLNKEIQSIKEK